MAYSVVTGPINFGLAPPGACEVDPFMDQLPSHAVAGVDSAEEIVHVQPPGSWPDIAVPIGQPEENAHSSAPAYYALPKDGSAVAEHQTRQNSSAAPKSASSLAETGSTGRASDDGCEELTSVTQLGQPRDRQLPALEVDRTLELLEGAHNPASTQCVREVLLDSADAGSAEPISPRLAGTQQNGFKGSGSHGAAAASTPAADLTNREGPSSPLLLQQHDHAAARVLAAPLLLAKNMEAHEMDDTSEPHAKQKQQFLPGLQPDILHQASSPAGGVHLAREGKGPAQPDHHHNPEQRERSLLANSAAQAGVTAMPHVTNPQYASTTQDAVLPSEAELKHPAEQQASPHSSLTRHSAEVKGGPVHSHLSNPDSTSAAAEGRDQVGLTETHDAAESVGSSRAISAITPVSATAAPSACARSWQHSSLQAVPLASADAGAGCSSHSQVPSQQLEPSLPACSAVPAATGGQEPAQSQLHTADESFADSKIKHTAGPWEGSSVTAQTTLPAQLAPFSSQAQPASSEHPHWAPHDADGHGSPEEGPAPSAAPQAASAGPTHAVGIKHRQAELVNVMGHMGAGMPHSDVPIQAGSDTAAHHAESEGATQEELLALAEAVNQLEAELADAREVVAKHEHEAEAARQEAAQWQDREADARAQMEAVREAYADMRSTAEAAQAQLSDLQAAEKGLQEQLSVCAQQARASEESKMRSRLDRAERAIEQERAANRDLQAALQACRQGGNMQADGSAAMMVAELAALRRDLMEASAGLASQKASNRGLQIRVADLLKGSIDAEALQAGCAQLKQERDALLASKHQWTTNETLLSSLKAQNNALHVTTEKLVSTNSELMERLNRQSEQVRALQDALAKAQAAQAPEKAALHQHEQGGARVTQAELELMALAQYVQELEGKLAKHQASAAGHQGAQDAHTGMSKSEAPGLRPKELEHSTVKQVEAEGHVPEQAHDTTEKLHSTWQQSTVQDSKSVGQAGASTEGSGDADVFSDEQVDAIKTALRPKSDQQGQQKQQSKGFWGYITDYITGADKLIQ